MMSYFNGLINNEIWWHKYLYDEGDDGVGEDDDDDDDDDEDDDEDDDNDDGDEEPWNYNLYFETLQHLIYQQQCITCNGDALLGPSHCAI